MRNPSSATGRRLIPALLLLGCCAWLQPAFANPTDARPSLDLAIDSRKPAKAQAAIDGGEDVNAVFEQDTMLCRAIAANQVEIAKLILQSPKVEVNKRGTYVDGFNNTWERTPLIVAAKRGFTDLVELLLEKGADINARDRINGLSLDRGSTALILAAWGDHLDTVKALFAHAQRADVNLRDKDGCTALWQAALNENLEMVQFLQGKGSKINLADNGGKSILTTTFLHKNFDVLDFLVAQGADINLVDRIGMTPLMASVVRTHAKKAADLKWLEHFLAFKPRLDLQRLQGDAGGDSALLLGAQFGDLEAIKLLLDQGATVDLASLASGRTPLFAAAVSRQVEAARCLIGRGAKTELADQSGLTPLTAAVLQVDPDMVRVLVEGGAATEVQAHGQNLTPLVAAASNLDPFKHSKCLDIIKILLDHHADGNFQAPDGRTALLAAAASTSLSQGLDTATLLLERGAHPDLANSRGETPLMLAAGNGNEKLVKLLLNQAARVDLKSSGLETAMNFAVRSGDKSIVAMLEAKGARAEAPAALPRVVVKALVGTWVGQQDGMPQAQFTLALNQDNTFNFLSRWTPEALKRLPKGSQVNPVIATQKGTYLVNNDFLVLNVAGMAPLSRKWQLDGKRLILDRIIKLKKTK